MRKFIAMLMMLIVSASVVSAEVTVNVLPKSQKALMINLFDLEFVEKVKVPSEKLTPSMAAAIVVAAMNEQIHLVIDDDVDTVNFIQLDDDGIYVYKYKLRP